MRRWAIDPRRACAVLLLAFAVTARGAPPPEPSGPDVLLEQLADALDDDLRWADATVSEAARDLGRVGLGGPKARARLETVCRALPFAASCFAVDDEGVLVTAVPDGRYESAVVGQRVDGLEEARTAALGRVFPSVDGFPVVSLRHPVYDRADRFLGAAGILVRPEVLAAQAFSAVVGDAPTDVVVVQTDGSVLYDDDPDGIGGNVLTDPRFAEHAEALALARRLVEDRRGCGEYHHPGDDATTPVRKEARWRTTGLYGTQWRVLLVESNEEPSWARFAYRDPVVPVSAEIALDAYVALVDDHLTDLADDFGLIASSEAITARDWERAEEILARVAAVNVPATYWLALPGGSHWVLGQGRASANLSAVPWFKEAVSGRTLLGRIVPSADATHNEAVVAVPVTGSTGRVVAVIGATVQLDALGALVSAEMGLGGDAFFYAFDAERRVALQPVQDGALTCAADGGPALERLVSEMRQHEQGMIAYEIEGEARTIVYRRSKVTGWIHAFGIVGTRSPAPGG